MSKNGTVIYMRVPYVIYLACRQVMKIFLGNEPVRLVPVELDCPEELSPCVMFHEGKVELSGLDGKNSDAISLLNIFFRSVS